MTTNSADQMYDTLQRSVAMTLSSIEPKYRPRVISKIKQSMIELELLKRGIVRPEPTFDEDDSAFDSFGIQEDFKFVYLFTFSGEQAGVALYDVAQHLPIYGMLDVSRILNGIFPQNLTLVNRIVQLINFFYDDETCCDVGTLVESLKSMVTFLAIKEQFKSPSITLNDDGTFACSWKKDNSNLITLSFKDGNIVDYVIFEPSKHTTKLEVSTGKKSIFKLIDDIQKLGLSYLIE